MKKILILILLVVMFNYCAPPRGRTGSNKYRGARVIKKNSVATDTNVSQLKTSIINYADTTIIEINPETAKYLSPIEREFNLATQLFKDSKYEQACPKIAALCGTLPEDDSLRFEAEFMNCECLVYQNKIINAKANLIGLINNPNVTDIIKQKAVVRLGQIYCYEENYEQAQLFFDVLKKEYPNSKYLKVANCDAIKK